MEMPERIKVNTDKSLTVFLDDAEFQIGPKEYLKSDKGKILLKHQTVMQLAFMSKTRVGPPILVSTHNPVVYVIARTATRGDESATELGESNAQNLYDDIMKVNPATTADNRAYERAVLKVLRIYGEVYGASEINYKDDSSKSIPTSNPISEKKESGTHETPTNNVAADVSPKPAEDKKDEKPFWWDDTGLGVYKESELEPETVIVTQGPCAGKNWTVKQLYDYNYKSCVYFAERKNLESAHDEFKKQVYACRRAIRKYGIQE